jgi:DNA primase
MITDQQLLEILPNPKSASQGSEWASDCLFCGRKQHFYINKKSHLWHCKICDKQGNEFTLLKKVGKLYLISGQDVDTSKKLETKLVKVTEQIDMTTPVKKLPIGFREILSNQYLENRGFSKSDLVKYRVGTTEIESKYENYLIFPVIEDGLVRGYVARYGIKVGTRGFDPDKLRYQNSSSTDFAKLLFGIDEIVSGKTKTVILVEGLVDKNTLDNVLSLNGSKEVKCCATFGKKVSKWQIQKLLDRGIERVILILDYDAIQEAKKYSMELNKYFEVFVSFTFAKDINDSTIPEIYSIFDRLRSPNSFVLNTVKKIKLK